MRIAQVCPLYAPNVGGIETHVRELSTRLVNRGHEVDVLTTDPVGYLPTEQRVNGVNVRRFRSFAPSNAYFPSFGLQNFLGSKASSYDVIHAHNYHALPALQASLTRPKRKFVFSPSYHGSSPALLRSMLLLPYQRFARGIFKKADHILCASNYEKNLVIKDFHLDNRRIALIPHGINRDEFRPKLQDRLRNVLYVGRLEKYKGVDYIVRAMARLPHDISLEIVGDGSHRASITRLAKDLGLQDRVLFTGELPWTEVRQRYAKAAVFVSLSTHEAYGITVLEALASGTPCVVANEAALSEWIDNRNCFGVEYPMDLQQLASTICKAMNVIVSIPTFPTWDAAADRTLELYES